MWECYLKALKVECMPRITAFLAVLAYLSAEVDLTGIKLFV